MRISFNLKNCLKIKTGFTLLELLLVILILAALITVSVPTLAKTAQNFHFRSRTKKLELLFKYLKQISIMEGRIYKFTLDKTQNRYEIEAENKKDVGGDFAKMYGSILRPKNLTEDLIFKWEKLDQEKSEIVFYPNGHLTYNEFYISDNKNNLAKITTTLSGEIKLDFCHEN